jgi:hypothetical protein
MGERIKGEGRLGAAGNLRFRTWSGGALQRDPRISWRLGFSQKKLPEFGRGDCRVFIGVISCKRGKGIE